MFTITFDLVDIFAISIFTSPAFVLAGILIKEKLNKIRGGKWND